MEKLFPSDDSKEHLLRSFSRTLKVTVSSADMEPEIATKQPLHKEVREE